MNAFTIPIKSIVIRQPSIKQMRNNAKRVNREEPSCVKHDLDKRYKLEKAAI